jgi:hypothetical protein
MKFQVPSSNLPRNPKLQISKKAPLGCFWKLEFGASLELGTWNLEL